MYSKLSTFGIAYISTISATSTQFPVAKMYLVFQYLQAVGTRYWLLADSRGSTQWQSLDPAILLFTWKLQYQDNKFQCLDV